MNYITSPARGGERRSEKQEIIEIFQPRPQWGSAMSDQEASTEEAKYCRRETPSSSLRPPSRRAHYLYMMRWEDKRAQTDSSPTIKTLSRRSVAKVLGEFSLKEHLFYAGIFFSMSLIVIFCFLLVNRDNSSSSSSSLSSAQLSYYDGGIRLACPEYFQQIVWKLSNDKTISFISIRRICCDCL